ncbi:hypothetical protein MAR_009485, partial [Mya arenaria]
LKLYILDGTSDGTMLSLFILLGLIVCDISVVVCQSSTNTQDLSMSRVNAAATTLSNHNIAESSVHSTAGMEVSVSPSKSIAEMSQTFSRLPPTTSANVASGDTNQTFSSSVIQTSTGLYRETVDTSIISHSKSLKMNSDEPGSVHLSSSEITRTIKPSKTVIRDSVNGSRTIATVTIDSTVLHSFVKSSDPKIAIEDSFTSRNSSSSHYTSTPVSNIKLSSTLNLRTSYTDTTSLRTSMSATFPTFTKSNSIIALSKSSSINSITQLSPTLVDVSNTAETRFIAPTKTTQINYSTIVDSSFGATSTSMRYFSEKKHSIHLTSVPLDNPTTMNGSGYSTLNSPSSMYSESSQYMKTTTTSMGKSSMTSNMPENTTKLSSSLELSSVPSTISFSEYMSAENLIKHSVTGLNSQTLTTNFSAHLQSNPILSDTFETLSTILHGISFSDNAFKSSSDDFIGAQTSSPAMSTPTITGYYSDSARGHHTDASKFVATIFTDKSHSFSSIVNSRILQTIIFAKTYSEENKSYDFTTSSTWKSDIKDTLSASDETKTYDALASQIIESATDKQHSTSEIKLSMQRSIIYTTSSEMQLSYSTSIKTKLTENISLTDQKHFTSYQTRPESTINISLLESFNIKASTESELLSTTSTSSLLMISVPTPMLTYGTTNSVVAVRTVGGSSSSDPSFALHNISTPPIEKSTIWNYMKGSESGMSSSYDQLLFTRTAIGSLDSSEINSPLLKSINITSSTDSQRLSIAATPSSPMTSMPTPTAMYGTTNSVATARPVVRSSSGDQLLSIPEISSLMSERSTIWNHAESAESGMSSSYDQSGLTSTAIISLDTSEIITSLVESINITSSSESQRLSIAAMSSSNITSVQTPTAMYRTTISVVSTRSVGGSSSGDPSFPIHDILTPSSESSTIWNQMKTSESGMSSSYDQLLFTSTAIDSLDSSEINKPLIESINITSSTDSQLLSIIATPSSPMTSVQTPPFMFETTSYVATGRSVIESASGDTSFSILNISIPLSKSSPILNHTKSSEASMSSSFDQSDFTSMAIDLVYSSKISSPFLESIKLTASIDNQLLSITATPSLMTSVKTQTLMYEATNSVATARTVGGSSSGETSFPINDMSTLLRESSTIWNHTKSSESGMSSLYDQSLFTSTSIGSLYSSKINKPLLESINITASTDSQLLSITATPSSPMTSVQTYSFMYGTTNTVATERPVVESLSGGLSYSTHDRSIPSSGSSAKWNHTKTSEAGMSSSHDHSLSTRTDIGSLDSSEMFAMSQYFPSLIDSTHLFSVSQISSTFTKYFPIPTFKSNSIYMFSSTVYFNEMSSSSILTHLKSLETSYSSYMFESIPAYSIRSSSDSIFTLSVSSTGSKFSPSSDFSASQTYITNVVLQRSTPYSIHSSESHVANENLNDTNYSSISPSSAFNISSIPSASESGSPFKGNVSTPILLTSSFKSKSDFLQASSSDISSKFLNVNVSQVQTNTMLITTSVQTAPVEFSTSLTSPLISLPTNIVVTSDATEVLLSTKVNNSSYKTNDIILSTAVISFGLSTWTSTFISSESTIASDSSSSVMTTAAVIQPSFTPVFSQSIVYHSTDSENVNHSTKYWNVYSNMSSIYHYTSTTPASSPDVNTDSLPTTDMLTSNIVFTSSPIDISSTRVSSASLFSRISKSSGNSVLETS